MSLVNSLKPSGNYVSYVVASSNTAFCICGLRMILTLNRDYFLNPLKPSGDYMYHLLYQSVILHFVFMGLVWFSV
jgi:hypothetical protein